jgi:putative ABC transport system permease protein
VSLGTLLWTVAFIVMAMAISLWQKLGVERDLWVAAVRCAVQLLLVGYILKAVFGLDRWPFTALMVLLMLTVAVWNASRRGHGVPGVWWKVACGIGLTEVITQGLLLGLRIVPATPQYVIPISGMIIGNAMVVSGLLLDRLQAEARARRDEIRVFLALGALPKQAARNVLRAAVRASMIPTIDSTKTTGLVQLPGMMTGQIIAGADPIQAVRYQILILFTLLAAAAITAITEGLLAYPALFNEYEQLRLDADGG